MTTDVASDLLGPLAVDDASLFAFPAGLFGFDDCRRFALVGSGRDGMYWLQSLERPALTFLLVDPFQHQAGYVADLPDAELAAIGVTAPDALLVLAIVTLGKPPHECTMNLQAPLAFNTHTRQARQVVLAEERHGMRAPLSMR